jgi:beta-alanine degradation protein BauB
MNLVTSFVYGTLFGAATITTALALAKTERDPIRISPQYYSVRVDNDRVRVLEYRLKPGEKEKAHSHPPGVLFTLSDARLRMTVFPAATVSDEDTHAGEVNWQDAVTHSAENIGASEFHSFRVELKPCEQP